MKRVWALATVLYMMSGDKNEADHRTRHTFGGRFGGRRLDPRFRGFISSVFLSFVLDAVLFEVGVVKIFLETLDERDGCLHPGSAYDALTIAVLREDIRA